MKYYAVLPEIVAQNTVDARVHLTVMTVTGDRFTIVKPPVSEELFAQMRKLACEILDEDRHNAC